MSVDWSDARAEDINQRAAVMFTWPYPGESNIDAATAFAQLVREACDGQLPKIISATYDVSTYEVGPAASGLFVSFLCTIVEDVRPYLDDAANLIALSTAARAIYRLTRRMVHNRRPYPPEWAANYNPIPENFRPVFSESMIIGLCFGHYSQSYSTDTRVAIDSVSRSPDPQYLSASHPGGSERYTIRIWTGQTSYVYVVNGRGDVLEHIMIRGKLLKALPMPDWFGESNDSSPGPDRWSYFEQSRVSPN